MDMEVAPLRAPLARSGLRSARAAVTMATEAGGYIRGAGALAPAMRASDHRALARARSFPSANATRSALSQTRALANHARTALARPGRAQHTALGAPSQ